jgi:hypothetical protein
MSRASVVDLWGLASERRAQWEHNYAYNPGMYQALRLTAMVAALLAGSSSSRAPKRHTFEKAMLTTASFDRTWAAVVEVFAENNWAIQHLERDSGLITTDWMLLAYDNPYADCGRTISSVGYTDQLRFNVLIREESDTVIVTVNAAFRRVEGAGAVWSQQGCYSTGQVEQLVHEQVSAVLAREPKGSPTDSGAWEQSPEPAAPGAGTEGGPCYGNDTCNAGLDCDPQRRCVLSTSSTPNAATLAVDAGP